MKRLKALPGADLAAATAVMDESEKISAQVATLKCAIDEKTDELMRLYAMPLSATRGTKKALAALILDKINSICSDRGDPTVSIHEGSFSTEGNPAVKRVCMLDILAGQSLDMDIRFLKVGNKHIAARQETYQRQNGKNMHAPYIRVPYSGDVLVCAVEWLWVLPFITKLSLKRKILYAMYSGLLLAENEGFVIEHAAGPAVRAPAEEMQCAISDYMVSGESLHSTLNDYFSVDGTLVVKCGDTTVFVCHHSDSNEETGNFDGIQLISEYFYWLFGDWKMRRKVLRTW